MSESEQGVEYDLVPQLNRQRICEIARESLDGRFAVSAFVINTDFELNDLLEVSPEAAWGQIHEQACASSPILTRSVRSLDQLKVAFEEGRLLKNGGDFEKSGGSSDDGTIKEISTAVLQDWAGRTDQRYKATAVVSNDAIAQPDILTTLADQDQLSLPNITVPTISMYSAGVIHGWTVQPYSFGLQYSLVYGAPTVHYLLPPHSPPQPGLDVTTLESQKAPKHLARVVVKPGETLVIGSGVHHLAMSLGTSVAISRATAQGPWERLAITQERPQGQLQKDWSILALYLRAFCGVPVRGLELQVVGDADGAVNYIRPTDYEETQDFSNYWYNAPAPPGYREAFGKDDYDALQGSTPVIKGISGRMYLNLRYMPTVRHPHGRCSMCFEVCEFAPFMVKQEADDTTKRWYGPCRGCMIAGLDCSSEGASKIP